MHSHAERGNEAIWPIKPGLNQSHLHNDHYSREPHGNLHAAPAMSHQWLVFSDLDGTLLDHFSYRYDAAEPALALLRERSIPLILCSSKTLAELSFIGRQLQLDDPFIIENGAAIMLPNGVCLHAFAPPLSDVLATLHRLRCKSEVDFTGFSEMTVECLAELTGLTREQAERAKDRRFTEPISWHSSDAAWQQFSRQLAHNGLNSARGGRFISISGGSDKGQALRWLKQHYAEQWQQQPWVIALGDSDNDRPMLLAADRAIIVRSPVHPPPLLAEQTNLIVTEAFGPEGWNRAILDEFHLER